MSEMQVGLSRSSLEATAGQVDVAELLVLEELAVLTEVHGPYRAAEILFATQVPAPAFGVPPAPPELVLPSPRCSEEQLVVVERSRHRGLGLLSRWWSR